MGETTSIQWTATRAPDGTMVEGATFNPWIGCARVSPECDHCYAESGSKRLGAQHGLALWAGDRYMTGDSYWKQPARWDRAAASAGVRRKVFCASYADVFEDRAELDARRDRLYGAIEATPHLDWLLLTKRPENMLRMTAPRWGGAWPGNVWAGTTIGVRASLPRLDHLARVPAVVRFVSMEPLLEDVLLPRKAPVDWCIIGGESGAQARPFDVSWARDLVDDCRAQGIAPFVKQLGAHVLCATPGGEWPTARREHAGRGWRLRLRDGHGGDDSEWPAWLRVREYPQPHEARPA